MLYNPEDIEGFNAKVSHIFSLINKQEEEGNVPFQSYTINHLPGNDKSQILENSFDSTLVKDIRVEGVLIRRMSISIKSL